MPTIDRVGPYRVFFYSNELLEPPHVHVQRGRRVAKFWLDPVRVAATGRFSRHELNRVEAIIDANHQRYQDAWHDYFEGQ